MERLKIITLCGSIKFRDEFEKICLKLTIAGNVVLTPLFLKEFEKTSVPAEIKNLLSKIHKRKIEISDEIFVINKGGYIGESTKSEIKYAQTLCKKIVYLEN